jgi:hypothetical protein
VNTGTKKSHGDIQTKSHSKFTKKEAELYYLNNGKFPDPNKTEIYVNCRLIPNLVIENDPNTTGEYNVERYLDAFNKRVKPLLVCFDPSVRDEIIIDTPSKRKYFTKQELELTSGKPFNETDQDKLEDLLAITDEELEFWNRIGISPTYMFEEYGIDDEFSYDEKTKRSVTQ